MSCILVAPLSRAGGVSITGIDLSKPLPPTSREHLVEAFRDYSYLVFPEQRLSREEQFKFVANFGKIEAHGSAGAQAKRYETAHVISNLDKDGNPVDRSSSPVSNYRWHTDKSYRAVPPLSTMLYAVELPPEGGDTEFANTRMAYAALPPETRSRIAGLRVVFRWGSSSNQSAMTPREDPPVDHPL